MHFCHENEKTVTGPICSRIVALYHQNSHLMESKLIFMITRTKLFTKPRNHLNLNKLTFGN